MKQHLLGILLAVAACFASLPTTYAQTDGDIVDRLNKALLVKLPAEFEAKVKEFAANDTIMRTRSATAFTEQFLIEQFKKDWGIDRQNQLLFMWSTIYSGITNKTLYEFLDDDNEARSDEYDNQLENINKFYESYKKGFKEYMEQKLAESDSMIAEYGRRIAESDRSIAESDSMIAEYGRRIAESDRSIAESDRRIAEYGRRIAESDRSIAESDRRIAEALTSSLKELVWFFNRYHMKDKEAIPPNETQKVKNIGKEVFTSCKDINLNYKAILSKELGDDKKVQELLKFYGVE